MTCLSLYLLGSCATSLSLSLYRCANSRCTLSSNICDDFNNCGDMSDEMGCSTTNTAIMLFTTISTVVLNLLAIILIL